MRFPYSGTHGELATSGQDAEVVPPVESEGESLEKKAGFLAWLHSIKSTVQEEINEQILPRWLLSGKPTDHIQVPEMNDLLEQPPQEEITGKDIPQIIESHQESGQTVGLVRDTGDIESESISEEPIVEKIEEIDQVGNMVASLPDLDASPTNLEHPKFTEEFDRLQADIEQQNFSKAAAGYHKLMKNSKNLLRVISSLEEAVQNNPEEITLIQTLGDAYVRSGRLQDALDTYTKAEELLK